MAYLVDNHSTYVLKIGRLKEVGLTASALFIIITQVGIFINE